MPSVRIPQKDITVDFPSYMTEEEIQRAIEETILPYPLPEVAEAAPKLSTEPEPSLYEKAKRAFRSEKPIRGEIEVPKEEPLQYEEPITTAGPTKTFGISETGEAILPVKPERQLPDPSTITDIPAPPITDIYPQGERAGPFPEGLGYLQKPIETALDFWNQYLMSPEEEKEMRSKYPNLMAARYAAASLFLPGLGEKLASPMEIETFQRLPFEEQQNRIIGLAAGYISFGAGTQAAKILALKAALKYPWLTKPRKGPIKTLFESNWYRRLRVKERGLIVQNIDDMIKGFEARGMTEGEILRALQRHDLTDLAYKRFAKAQKITPEPEVIIPPEPPKKPVEVKPEVKPVEVPAKEVVKPIEAKPAPVKTTISPEAIPEVGAKPKESPTPFEYQSEIPEKIVHRDWDRANSIRFILESSGDMLREFSKFKDPNIYDGGYIKEKLNRIDKYLKSIEAGTIHIDDTLQPALKTQKKNLDDLIAAYENQPIINNNQELAKKITLAIARGNNREARNLHDKINIIIKPKEKKPTKLYKPRKQREEKVLNLRGAIRKLGNLKPIKAKGKVSLEMKDISRFFFASVKKGQERMSFDLAEEQLKREGWLNPDEELQTVLKDPANFKRNKVVFEGKEKPEHLMTDKEKRVKKEMAWEPEASPKGECVQVKAEDLPEGATMTIIEGKTRDGWDQYKIVAKDPFTITLQDGGRVDLSPNDIVEVLKVDLTAAKPAEIPDEAAAEALDIYLEAKKPGRLREEAEKKFKQAELLKKKETIFGLSEEMKAPIKGKPKEKGLAAEKIEREKTSKFREGKLFGPDERQQELFSPEAGIPEAEPISIKRPKAPMGLRRSAHLSRIAKKLGVPIKVGKFRKKRGTMMAGGIYKTQPRVIRLAKANDFVVAMHEIGHDIQSLLGLTGRMPKEVMDLAYPKAKNKSLEGFAEFNRMYVTEPKEAKAKAPIFYKAFEQALKDHPDVQDVIVKARQFWHDWQALPSVEKVGSFIVKGGEKKGRYTFNEIYTHLVDELRPLQQIRDIAVERRGKEFAPSEDPFTLAWLIRGWARKSEQYIKYGTFQVKAEGIEFTGDSLKDILAPIEKKGLMDMLDIYLVSKRAESDPRILKGFEKILSEADFKQAVKDLEPIFKETAEKLYKYSDELLTYLTDAGRISQEVANKIRSKNLFYAPLYRVIDSESPLTGMSRKKYGSLFSPIKRLRGSSRDIYSPTENILYNTYTMINIAERNRVGEALFNLTKIQGMGDIIERVPVPVKPVKFQTKEALAQLAKYFENLQSDRAIDFQVAIEDILGHNFKVRNIEAAMRNAEKKGESALEAMENALEKAGLEPEDMFEIQKVLIAFKPNYRTAPNEAIFYIDGEPHIVEMNKELLKAVQAIDNESISALIKIASYPAKWLRVGATLTPEFVMRNPARDQLTAFVYSKYGYIPGFDLIRGIYHIGKAGEMYQTYNASGAAHAALVSLDRDYIEKNLKEVLRGKKPIDIVKNPLKIMQALSELTEEATRVGEFVNVLKSEGKDLNAVLRAGKEARDITLDFSRIGLKIRAMNMITAFFNAQIQGTDKMIRAFKDNPKSAFMKAFIGLTLPSIALYLAQKDDPYFQEIPTWRRIFFWNIVTHHEDGTLKHIWSIPKPFELGLIFGSAPEMALDWYYRKDPEGFKEFSRALIDGLFPSFIPTFGVGIAEWWANRSIFLDRPLVPRGKEDLEPVDQYSRYTSETIKAVASAMDKVPGLEKYANPAKIENLIRGYTGGMGKHALNAIDELLTLARVYDVPPRPKITLERLPGLKGFMHRFPSANTRSIERFYSLYTKEKREWETKKERAGVRGYGIKIEQPDKLKEYEATAKALSMLRKLAGATYDNKNMNPELKKGMMDKYYLMMINVSRVSLGLKIIKLKD